MPVLLTIGVGLVKSVVFETGGGTTMTDVLVVPVVTLVEVLDCVAVVEMIIGTAEVDTMIGAAELARF